jgi:hypothetical protein
MPALVTLIQGYRYWGMPRIGDRQVRVPFRRRRATCAAGTVGVVYTNKQGFVRVCNLLP